MKYTELYVQFLESLVEKNTEEVSVLTAHRDLLKDELSKLKAESTERIKDLEASADRLFKALDEKYDIIAKQGDKIDQCHSTMYKLEAERNELSMEVSKLRAEKENWLKDIGEINVKTIEHISQIKEELDQKSKELDQRSKELSEMSEQLAEKQEIIDVQEQKIEHLLCELEQCQRSEYRNIWNAVIES